MAKVKIKNPEWVVKRGDLITFGTDGLGYLVAKVHLSENGVSPDCFDLIVLYSPSESHHAVGSFLGRIYIPFEHLNLFRGEVTLSNY